MAVETATKIHQLNASSPSGADPLSEGAAQIRVVKAAVKGSFPAFGVLTDTGVVNLGADEINNLPTLISAKADTNHNHDGAYAPISHTHATLSPGNGLTGSAYNGGTAQTFALGTPATLTSATSNGVTASSHTHAIGSGIMKAHVGTGGATTVSTGAPTGGNNGDVHYRV